MLSSVHIEAFKSFVSGSLILKPLTLLSGINNSGKSTVIQSLRMFCNGHVYNNPLLDGLGDIDELRSKYVSSDSTIKIMCGWAEGQEAVLEIGDEHFSPPVFAPLYSYVGADRFGPKTYLPLYRSLDTLPQVGDTGQFVYDFMNKIRDAIIPEILHHDNSEGRTFDYELKGWLTEIAHLSDIFYEIDRKRDSSHAEFDSFRPAHVGFGISYSLPVIVSLLGMSALAPSGGWEEAWGNEWDLIKNNYGALVMLENPEAHLHPRGQTAIGKLIALAASIGVQVVVETHSDHLMDGIRIAIKENLISSDDVIFHYFKNSSGITEVETPVISNDGKLSYWPDGFFDQTLINRAKIARK